MKKRPFLIATLSLLTLFVLFFVVMVGFSGMKQESMSFALGDKVGVVEINGAISESRKTIEQLQDFAENTAIKAMVLRIDSPGGGVGPSQEIYDEVVRIVKIKPVIVSMGSVAASGGYYIAAPASKIFANPGTITGSIGVIMTFTNVLELMDKVGLKNKVVKSGIHKDIGSSVREMTVAEQALLQDLIDDVHSQFVAAVCSGRKLPEQQVREISDGRIFSGRQALKYGFVDALGGLQAAINEAALQGGIVGKPKVIYPAPEQVNFIDYFIEGAASQVQKHWLQNRTPGLQLVWTPAS